MFRAFYDLANSPPTFDVIAFLCEVERERVRRGDDEVEIVMLPGPNGGFRNDRFWPRSILEREKLRESVAIPLCKLLPSARSVRVAMERPVGGFGAGIGLYGLARQVQASRDGIRPLRATLALRADEPVVTITLRECEHWPERNSKVEEWAAAASRIRSQGWRVIVVRDELQHAEPLRDLDVDQLAARSIPQRAMLYASATVNLFVSNGPAWMAMAMDAPVLMMRPVTEGLGGPFGAKYLAACGIEPKGQMPGSPARQRLVWQDDTADQIMAAFDAYVGDMQLRCAA